MIKSIKLPNIFSHHLFKRIFSVAIWSGVSKILLFAISIIIARILDPEEYGKYILFMVVLNAIVNVFDLRLSQVVIPEMKQIQNKKLLSFINISLETFMAFLGFVALYLFVFFGLNQYIKLEISSFELMLSFIFILGYHIQRAALTTTQAYENYGKYNVITVMFPFLFLVAILIFYKFLDGYAVAIEYRSYSLGVLGLIALSMIYKNTFVNILQEIKGFKEEFKKIFKTILKHSQTSMIIGWLSLVYYNADRLMIGWLGTSSAEVGFYVNAILLGTLLTHFSNSIVQAIYPNFSKAYLDKDIKQVKKYLKIYNRFVFFIIMPIAILLAVYSEEVILLFFGEKYIESAIIFQIWILFIPIYIWPSLLLKLVYIKKEHRRFLPYIGLAVIINIVLNYLLIPYYGIVGAVFSTIICFSINAFFAFKISREYLKVKNDKNIYIYIYNSFKYLYFKYFLIEKKKGWLYKMYLSVKYGSYVSSKSEVYKEVSSSIVLGKSCTIEDYCIIGENSKNSKVEIGDYFQMRKYSILMPQKNGFIKIGNNCSLQFNSKIYGEGDVVIGNNVRIATNVVILSSNKNYNNKGLSFSSQGTVKDCVQISDNVWIGANVVILSGTKLGKNIIVAAGSIVTKNFEENCIIAGNPAKIIKNL